MLIDETIKSLLLTILPSIITRKKSTQPLLIFIIISLFLISLLFFKLQINDEEELNEMESIYSSNCSHEKLKEFYELFGRVDKEEWLEIRSQRYKPNFCVHYSLWEPSSLKLQNRNDPQIGLAIHATPNLFEFLEKQLDTWDGLISLTLTLPSIDEEDKQSQINDFAVQHILETLHRLKKSKKRYDRVWIHLLFESQSNECPILRYKRPRFDSLTDLDYAKMMQRDMSLLCASKRPYAINVARNVARLGLKTPLFLSTDIENLLSWHYAIKAKNLANDLLVEKNQKTVLVHRRFEVERGEVLSRSLKTLKMLYERQKAFVFHELVFPQGHQIPDLVEWFEWKKDNDFNEIEVQKTLEYSASEWEPQFIARNDETVPLHDESFPFRIRPNVELAHELCRANFTFTIMHSVFSVHEGVKRKEARKYQKLVDQTTRSRLPLIVKEFRQKLNRLYGETKGKCPVFAPEIPG